MPWQPTCTGAPGPSSRCAVHAVHFACCAWTAVHCLRFLGRQALPPGAPRVFWALHCTRPCLSPWPAGLAGCPGGMLCLAGAPGIAPCSAFKSPEPNTDTAAEMIAHAWRDCLSNQASPPPTGTPTDVCTSPPPSLQAKWSSIDFDYLAYAQLRWGEYYRRRDEFLAAAEAAFPA